MLAREIKANLFLLLVGVVLMLIEVVLDFRDSTRGEIIEAVVLLPIVYLLVVLAPLRYLLLGCLWGARRLLNGSAKK